MHCIAIFQFSLIYNFISLSLLRMHINMITIESCRIMLFLTHVLLSHKKYFSTSYGFFFKHIFFYLMHRWISSSRMSLFKLCSISQFFFHFLSLLFFLWSGWFKSCVDVSDRKSSVCYWTWYEHIGMIACKTGTLNCICIRTPLIWQEVSSRLFTAS